jgi:hypothetical protein
MVKDFFLEFLTEETTCTNEMSKETTSENHCQKRPPTSGGTPGQPTRGTCRLGQCRQGGAAIPVSGRSGCHSAGGPCRHLPPSPVAAGWPGTAAANASAGSQRSSAQQEKSGRFVADSRPAQVPMQKEKSGRFVCCSLQGCWLQTLAFIN